MPRERGTTPQRMPNFASTIAHIAMMVSVSPEVLRKEQVHALETAYASAQAGSGRLVLISGEAGAGKSTLLRAFAAQLPDPADLLVGYCDPLTSPRPAGPLIDVAARLDSAVADMLSSGQRRGLFEMTLTAMAEGRFVVAFEDLHWADELSLELLGFLARRIGDVPLLLVATYRDDEIGGEHPLRNWLGTLATAPDVERLPVPPLSVEQVAQLAEGRRIDVAELHARTGGNAFFVTEVLATEGGMVPVKVADAVLARCALLSAPARRALLTAAVIGARSEPSLLLAIDGVSAAAVEECVSAGLLVFDAPVFVFRHELVRQAVLAEASTFTRTLLHAEVLKQLRESDPDALARLAEHAEQGGDAAAVLDIAPRAAKRAACLGSHREAARQYQRALSFAAAAPSDTRIDLLEALAYELYLTGELDGAFAARRDALELYEDEGAVICAAEQLRWMSRICWYAARRIDAEEYARRSIDMLEPAGPSAQLGMAYSNLAQLLMLSGRHRASVALGEKALAIAKEVADVETRVHALNTIGTAKVSRVEPGGVELIERSLHLALEHDMEDHAARAYVNLVSVANEHRDTACFEKYFAEGAAYCASRELDLQWFYLQANLARALLQRGDWDAAERVATNLITYPLIAVHRFVAILPLLMLRIRRGQAYDDLLPDALALAELLGEPQRTLPLLCMRAEAAWLDGTLGELRAELAKQADDAIAGEEAWRLAEVHRWLAAADPAHIPPAGLTGLFGEQLAAAPAQAAAAWSAADSPYEAALALLDGDADDVRTALTSLQRLGAEPAARIARGRLRELGVSVPRGPRRTTADNAFGLTAREDDVLHLLTDGLSNAEIAKRLVLSERTVHHHVASVFAKLVVHNRAAAASVGRTHGYGQD